MFKRLVRFVFIEGKKLMNTTYSKRKNINNGAALLFIFFSLLFLLCLGRIVYIQATGTVDGQVLEAKAEAKTLKERVIEAKRGSILDRNGNIIAEDTSSYTLVAILSDDNPKHVVDPEETARILADYIDMDEADILALLKKDRYQVEFGAAGRDISHTLKSQIEELQLPGITFNRETKRFYPNGVFASHVIGYVEKQDNEDTKETETVGMLGIEKNLQSTLSGTDGTTFFNTDRWGFLLPNSEERVVAAENGDNVQLTLDKKIQTFLEDSLNTVQKQYNPEKIIAIVADPKTGEILAMGQRPSFDPSTKEGINDTWKNLALEEYYEPGSTMKVFTLAAAVEEGVFYPNATYQAGSIKVADSKLNDHSGIDRGETLTYLQAVQRSSNVGFVKLALELLGEDKFLKYLQAFGFDSKTGIDLPNEVSGKILYERQVEKATTAFGQGTVVTPIQQIQAFTAIANEGKMMKPYVISKVVDSSGDVVEETKPTVAGTPISAETAEKVREYLETVVSAEKGTGQKYAIEGYTVAGKTGTAQIPGSNGKYMSGENDYIYSFLGMAPADDPELIMYVAIEQPNVPTGKTAADALASIFNPVMKNSLQYLNIKSSTVTSKKEMASIPDYEGQSASKAKDALNKLDYDVLVIGDGDKVISQSPSAGTKLIPGEKVILKTSNSIEMPDIIGWSLRDVMKLANMLNLELTTSGSGYVSTQSIEIGQSIEGEEFLIIELLTPEKMLENVEDNEEETEQTEDDGVVD